jgi:hypothetical protein
MCVHVKGQSGYNYEEMKANMPFVLIRRVQLRQIHVYWRQKNICNCLCVIYGTKWMTI